MILKLSYECETAHQLTAGVPEGHQCRRLHGHRYEVEVSVHSDINPETGMMLEYSEIDALVIPVTSLVDHRCINFLGFEAQIVFEMVDGKQDQRLHIERLPFEFKAPDWAEKVRANPTVEHLGQWLYAELNEHMKTARTVGFLQPHIARVEIKEDSRSVFVADSWK